ncbi:MAG TPA: molybdopterin-binding protein [Thermoanaerobaculia bacterium]|nr:molybdopterin-binding protein [Thermoanaerobaculia bacterium]
MVASSAVSVEQHRSTSPTVLGFAILTVSDSRGHGDDRSGRLLRELAAAAGHRIESSSIVPDEVAAIRQAAGQMIALPGVDVVVVTGGTGLAPRDRTLEALAPSFEKPIEGFGELFRMLSYQQVGAAAMLSRAAAGLIGGRAVFLLPGSPAAVTLAMEKLILPEAGHLLGQVRRSPG